MNGGDSKILTEKAVPDYPENEKAKLNSAEMLEAQKLVDFLNTYAERNITRKIDADDLREAASSAFSRGDIELLRAYSHSVGSPFFDVFVTTSTVQMLRKYGYTPVSKYFTEDTETISQNILTALLGASSSHATVFADHNSDKICAYSMANPEKAAVVENIIRERGTTSFDRIMALVDGGVENSLMDGVL